MSRALRGYTIIEVLIVLAISTTLLFAAIAVFKGQQGETVFTQAVQDLNSKILNYTSQVTAGTFPESQDYTCTPGVGGVSPSLTQSGTNNLGSRQGCVFLGRAIQIETKNGSNINAYTIIGNATTSGGDTASSISDTNPVPATIVSGGATQFVMNDSYTLAGGTKIISAVAKTTSGPPHSDWMMAGIYSDLNGSASSQVGNLKLDMVGYPLPSGGTTSSVEDCIEGASCLAAPLSQWDLCIQSSDGSHTMLLSVISNSTGVTTKLTDGC